MINENRSKEFNLIIWHNQIQIQMIVRVYSRKIRASEQIERYDHRERKETIQNPRSRRQATTISSRVLNVRLLVLARIDVIFKII